VKSALAKVATPVVYAAPQRVLKQERAVRRDPVEGVAVWE
jgi:hypothetical protein